MATVEQTIHVYEQLAEWYDTQAQPKLRDWFLVLATDAAHAAGQLDQADRFRLRLLERNPHHLLRPFASFAEALQSADISQYVADLRVTYPLEVAKDLLAAQLRKAPEPEAVSKKSRAAPVAMPFGSAGSEVETELKVYRVTTTAPEPIAEAPNPRRTPAPVLPTATPRAPEPSWLPPPVTMANRPSPQRSAAIFTDGDARDSDLSALAYDPETATGTWVSNVLFIVVLVAALGVAAYALVRPFLPPPW